MHNSSDNAFQRSLVEVMEPTLARFFEATDYAESSRRAIRSDLLRFGRWYVEANNEPFNWERVVTRDVADFREHLVRVERRAIATVNRCLVMVRRVFDWLVLTGELSSSPAKTVKELRRQPLAPKGLTRAEVRKLLREAETRHDARASAVFHALSHCGLRVSELAGLSLGDLDLGERSGWARVIGKGNKQRMVPVPLPARKALLGYLACRPPFQTDRVFVGERGPLTARGIRNICCRYAAITGVRFSPHRLRHTFASNFLAETSNDLVALAAILGHESLETTRRYTQRTEDELSAAAERVVF